MDKVSKEKRSQIMSKIRGKNTKPEILVRHILRERGFGYRLHIKELPGKPDIVLTKYKTVIFVHGCFWHGHPHMNRPKSNTEFWNRKIDGNIRRDIENRAKLERMGWNVIVIWECEIKSQETIDIKLGRIGR